MARFGGRGPLSKFGRRGCFAAAAAGCRSAATKPKPEGKREDQSRKPPLRFHRCPPDPPLESYRGGAPMPNCAGLGIIFWPCMLFNNISLVQAPKRSHWKTWDIKKIPPLDRSRPRQVPCCRVGFSDHSVDAASLGARRASLGVEAALQQQAAHVGKHSAG